LKTETGIQDFLAIADKRKYWILLSFILLTVVFLRVRLLDFPLERDEGEFAYIGKLILEGIPPYSEAANMKLPGTYYMYALIMLLFGQTTIGIHIGLMLINLISIVLLHRLAEKITNPFAAIFAAATFAILSLNSSVLGFAAHATHFIALPAIIGTILLHNAISGRKRIYFFYSGLMFGLAFLMKQPGVFFILFALLVINWNVIRGRGFNLPDQIKQNSLLMLGGLIPFLLVIIYIYLASDFEKFTFWIFQYSFSYGESIAYSEAISNFSRSVVYVMGGFFIIWFTALAGLGIVLWRGSALNNKAFIGLFAVCSFMTILPGLHFRPHYYIALLPATSILVGITVDHFRKISEPRFILPQIGLLLTILLFLLSITVGLGIGKDYFFTAEPRQLSRKIYEIAPFPESEQIAKEIAARTNPEDKIFVFGNEPQIYFHANRRSATSFMYLYPLMETHDYNLKMQKEMIEEIEEAKPEIIVITQTISWDLKPNSDTLIFQWLHTYTQSNYNLIGVIDIVSEDSTIYRWGNEAMNYIPLANFYLLVLQRSPHQIQHSAIRYDYLSPFGPLGSGMPFLENQPEEIITLITDSVYHKPVAVTLPDETSNIYFGLDTVTMNENILKITGWAFIHEQHADNCRRYICLKSELNQYVFTTNRVRMPSVSKAFGNPNLDESGFKTSIETSHLIPGVYSIGIYISKENDVQALSYTDYRITVVDQLNLP